MCRNIFIPYLPIHLHNQVHRNNFHSTSTKPKACLPANNNSSICYSFHFINVHAGDLQQQWLLSVVNIIYHPCIIVPFFRRHRAKHGQHIFIKSTLYFSSFTPNFSPILLHLYNQYIHRYCLLKWQD